MRNAFLAVHQLIGVIVVEDHHAFGAEHFHARRVPKRRIFFRQRVAHTEFATAPSL